jgi:hypothetical protein
MLVAYTKTSEAITSQDEAPDLHGYKLKEEGK